MHDDELADIETRIAEHEEFMRYQIDRQYIPVEEIERQRERGVRIGHA